VSDTSAGCVTARRAVWNSSLAAGDVLLAGSHMGREELPQEKEPSPVANRRDRAAPG